jgi:hypothetical protein
MMALSLGLGLAIGTCVRRDAEAPVRYIGASDRESPAAGAGSASRPG